MSVEYYALFPLDEIPDSVVFQEYETSVRDIDFFKPWVLSPFDIQ